MVSGGLFFVTLISPEVPGLGIHGKHDLELSVHICQLHLMARDSVALLTVIFFCQTWFVPGQFLARAAATDFPRLDGLNDRTLSLTLLEPRKSKMDLQVELLSDEGLILGLPIPVFWLYLSMTESREEDSFLGPLHKGINSIHKSSTTTIVDLPEALFLTLSHQDLGFQLANI